MDRQSASPELDAAGLKTRDPEAITRWFEQYADRVYTFVFYRVGKDPELCADVTQETFLTALSNIERFDPERGKMLPWLTYTARNCARKALRQRARTVAVGDFWQTIDQRLLASLSKLSEEILPDEILEREETADLVRMALTNLPPRYQDALEQRYFAGRSIREIADHEELSEGAVKSLLHRARAAFAVAFSTIPDVLNTASERRPT